MQFSLLSDHNKVGGKNESFRFKFKSCHEPVNFSSNMSTTHSRVNRQENLTFKPPSLPWASKTCFATSVTAASTKVVVITSHHCYYRIAGCLLWCYCMFLRLSADITAFVGLNNSGRTEVRILPILFLSSFRLHTLPSV